MKRPILVLAAIAAALALPSSAYAALGHSTITSPSSFAAVIGDGTLSAQGSITIAGTTDFGNADILCVPSLIASTEVLATNVPVSGGTFSTDFTPDPGAGGLALIGRCRLHAVPTGYSGTSFGTFSGPAISLDSFSVHKNDPSAPTDTYSMTVGQSSGQWDYSAVSDCAVADSYLLDPAADGFSTQPFNCVATITGQPGASPLQVDGKNAFAASYYSGLASTPGFNGVSATYTLDHATGEASITEQQQLMTCPANAWEPTYFPINNCSPVQSLPVKLVRTITQNHDGATTTVRDRFESTDGQSHTISAGYRDAVCLYYGGCSAHAAFDFPGHPEIDDPSTGPVSGPFPDGSTIKAFDQSKLDGDVTSGRVGVTISPAADDAVFASDHAFFLNWNTRTIPESGAYTIVQRFDQAFSDSVLTSLTSQPLTGGGPVDAAAPPVAPASITTSGKPKAAWQPTKKQVIVGTAKKVSCPPAGGSCSVTVTLGTTFKKNGKKKTYKFKTVKTTIAAGAVAGIAVAAKPAHNPLYSGSTKDGFNPLYGKLTFTGSITATAAGATPTTAKLNFKLKLPKIPKKR